MAQILKVNHSMPTILAIDSSIGISSVSIWKDGKVAVYLEDARSTMQASRLVPLIEEALLQADITYSDLSQVAATVGPGSFTGIRIGLATARGIAFSAGISCVGYTTLQVMCEALNSREGGDPCLCILNAGKGEVYYQHFPTMAEPAIGELTAILEKYKGAKIACGVPLSEGFTASITHPRADALARLAATNPAAALPPAPFYIRPPDAKPHVAAAGKVS